MHQSFPILCISEELVCCIKDISLRLRRDLVVNTVKEEIRNYMEENRQYITIVGLLQDFDITLLDDLVSRSIIFSVVCVNNKEELQSYYNKIEKSNVVEIDDIYCADFLREESSLVENELLSCKAGMLTGHGDYLCFNMKQGILCSQKESENRFFVEQIPACVRKKECYRKQRLKDDNAATYYIQDLQAELLFINTCAGVAFDNRKFDLRCKSLSDAFLLGRGLVYISNFMIGAFNHDETCIFYAMLHYYKNLSLTLQKYNYMIKHFYHKQPTAIMLGDAMVKAEYVKMALPDVSYKIIESNAENIIIEIEANSLFKVVSVSINLNEVFDCFDLQDSVLVDMSESCKYKIGILKESIDYRLFLYLEEVGCTEKKFVLFNKEYLVNKCRTVYSNLNRCLFLLYSLDINKEIKHKVVNKYLFFCNEVYKYMEFPDDLKGNVEYTTYGYNIIKKAETLIDSFNYQLTQLLIDESKMKDTHLILDNRNLILKNEERIYEKCPTCNSFITKMNFKSILYDGYIYQFVCPKCEIYHVTNKADINVICEVKCIENYIYIEISDLNCYFSNPQIGIALIATNYNINTKKGVSDNKTTFKLKITREKLAGAYYLRIIIVENTIVSILHKRIYF